MLDAQDKYLRDSSPVVVLADSLTRDKSSEKAKAEKLFVWITDNVEFAENGPETVSEVLEKKLAGAAGYSTLFQVLAEASGLESQVISGQSKGYSYLPDVLHEHTWNAVKIDGRWRLLDLTWGSGSFELDGSFSRARNMQWFLTPAEIFSYLNYPQETDSLFLEKTLTESEFRLRPRLLPEFFELALSLEPVDGPSAEVEREQTIQIKSGKGALLKPKIRPLGGSFVSGASEVKNESGLATFKLLFPKRGSYEVQIRARLESETKSRYVGSCYVSVMKDPKPIKTPEPRLTPTPDVTTQTVSTRPIVPRKVVIDHDDVERAAQEIIEGATSDREKAHALYRWLGENIAYDTYSFFNKKNTEYPDQSGKAVLQRRDAVCAGYSELFHEMAEAVGLESKILSGYTRKDDYDPQRKFTGSDHAWNAVKIDGEWQLLDATWGAGSVDDQTQKFTRGPQDGWFMTPPEIFLNTHLPEDEKWQLVKEKVSPEEFNVLPQLNGRFVEYGLTLVDPKKGLYEVGGQVAITVLTDNDTRLSAELENEKGVRIERSVLVNRRDGKYEVFVRTPEKGFYSLLLFAKKPGEEKALSVGKLWIQSSVGSESLFPHVFGSFSEHECALLQGYDDRAKAGIGNYYEVTVPGASEVYMTQGRERKPMKKSGDDYGLSFTPQPGEFGIVAVFEEGNMYILKYQGE